MSPQQHCYICGDFLIPTKGHQGHLEPKHATSDHVPPDGIFNKPKPSNLITVPCCHECNNKHSDLDEQFRVFLALGIGGNEGGQKIALEKVFGSTMKKTRQRKFMIKLHQSIRDEMVSSSYGNMAVSLLSFDAEPIRVVVRKIVKGLLAHFYPAFDYYADRFEILDIHATTLAKGDAEREMNVLREIISKTRGDARGSCNEFRFWYQVDSENHCGVWLLLFYESTFFVVSHQSQQVAV